MKKLCCILILFSMLFTCCGAGAVVTTEQEAEFRSIFARLSIDDLITVRSLMDEAIQMRGGGIPTYPPGEPIQYVLNTSSKKFHISTCLNAKSIKESNKELSYETREELITQGYKPCGTCNP